MLKRFNRQQGHPLLFNCAGLLMLALTVGAVLGCASGPRFAPSNTVSRQFETGQLIPDHRYYVGGPQAKPNAIVAIDSSYELESDHWRSVEPNSAALKRLVKQVRFVVQTEYQSALRPNGARIEMADGVVVGAWYSVYNYSLVQQLEDNRITISEPLADLPRNLPKPL